MQIGLRIGPHLIVSVGEDLVTPFERLQAQGVDKVIVAMPFRLEERYAIIETPARDVIPRVRAAG